MRTDTENLLMREVFYDSASAIHAIDMKKAHIAISDSKGRLTVRFEDNRVYVPKAKIGDRQLRMMVCHGISELASPPKPELIAIKDVDQKLDELLGQWDLPYKAMLVSPNICTKFEISKRPRSVDLFVNPVVPDGMIYGLATHEFLGVVAHWQDGNDGMLISNERAIASVVVPPVVQIIKGRKEKIKDWMMLSEIIES